MTSRISRPTSSRSTAYSEIGAGSNEHGETHSLDDPRARSGAFGFVLPAGIRPAGVAPARIPDVQAAVSARRRQRLRNRTHLEPESERTVHARFRLRPCGVLR